MRVFVPFDARDPNTRLSPVLTETERHEFAESMLADVLSACRGAGLAPTVLATEPIDPGAPVRVDDRPLTPAVNEAIAATDETVAIVMADLALATPAALRRFVRADGDVVLAPGRVGGTNAVLAREPAFRVDYHGVSIHDHLRAARAVGASVREFDSFRLAVDVDEPPDLLEVLLHGEGTTAAWLGSAGFGVGVGPDGPELTQRDR